MFELLSRNVEFIEHNTLRYAIVGNNYDNIYLDPIIATWINTINNISLINQTSYVVFLKANIWKVDIESCIKQEYSNVVQITSIIESPIYHLKDIHLQVKYCYFLVYQGAISS